MSTFSKLGGTCMRTFFHGRKNLRTSRVKNTFAKFERLEPRQLLASVTLDPVTVASISDTNSDGTGDQFNASTPWLLRQINGVEARAISEFNVSEFATIDGANLSFELAINNGLDTGTRFFNVIIYAGNGQSDLSDFSKPGQIAGVASLTVAESIKTVNLNLTSYVSTLVSQGVDFIGVKLDPTTNSAPSVFQQSKLSVSGTPVVTNQAPLIQGQSFSISESASSGASLGRVIANDPDIGQSLTYAITSGNETGVFEIDQSNGDLRLSPGASLDYETRARYLLTVSVTDNGSPSLSAAANMAINVQDENDTAPTIFPNQVFHVAEDAAVNTSVGTVNASDRDTVGSLQGFAIVAGNDDGIFTIDAQSGVIRVFNSDPLDFDLKSSYSLAIQVSDGVQLSAVTPVTILVDPLPAFTTVVPAFQASIQDSPLDGTGDRFNDAPFHGLLRQQSGVQEDRAIAEFDFSGLGRVKGGLWISR